MTELYINQKLNQLVKVDYDDWASNPLEPAEDNPQGLTDDIIRFFVETQNVTDDLISNLFNGDEGAYQTEHDKYSNAADLFEGLSKIAAKQGMLIYPIAKYEHSLVKYYLGADQGWDSDTVGFVLVNAKQFKQDYRNGDKADIESTLDNLLEAFTNYANGDIYCATIYQLNSKGEKMDELDYAGDLQPDDITFKGLSNLGLLAGDLKDWKEAAEKVRVSYIPAD